jgi:hypothetical protein
MARCLFVPLLFVVLAGGQAAASDWIQWRVEDGGNGHWYRLTDVAGEWNDAEAEAETYGAHLVTLNNATEEDWVRDAFNIHFGGDPVWIGFNDVAQEGHWTWVAGDGGWWESENPSSTSYVNWCTNQPSNGPTEYYGITWSCDPEAEGWNDGSTNSSPYRGLVECDFQPGEIPAVSEWGLLVMALLGLAAGTVMFRQARRRALAT